MDLSEIEVWTHADDTFAGVVRRRYISAVVYERMDATRGYGVGAVW